MRFLDKLKILDFMGKRKDALYNQEIRDFGGGFSGRNYEHSEVKFWKEAIERGEFDSTPEVYVILSATQPEIVDFTYYIDKEAVSARVEYLNKLAKRREFWYLTLYYRQDTGEVWRKVDNTDG
jgi:hypothetical protein